MQVLVIQTRIKIITKNILTFLNSDYVFMHPAQMVVQFLLLFQFQKYLKKNISNKTYDGKMTKTIQMLGVVFNSVPLERQNESATNNMISFHRQEVTSFRLLSLHIFR